MGRSALSWIFSSTFTIYSFYLYASVHADIYSNSRRELAHVVEALTSNETEVALVSFTPRSNRSPDARAQVLRMKKTAWFFHDRAFRHFVETNAQQRKKIVAVVTDLRLELKTFSRLIQYRYVYYAAVHWILVRDIDEMEAEKQSYKAISPPVRLSVLGCAGSIVINALIYSSSRRRPISFSAEQFPEFMTLYRLSWSEKRQRFSGNVLRVGCLYMFSYRRAATSALNPSLCHAARNRQLLELLGNKNVSLRYIFLTGRASAASALMDGKIDLIIAKTNLEGGSVTMMSYGDVEVTYDTLYARANDTRTVSVFDVFAYSTAGVCLTVTCIVASAVVLAYLSGNHSLRNIAVHFPGEAMFLLATLLATALPESQQRRHRRIRLLLYLIWYLCILSLSAYIRSEMTALVTVTAPADHLDTVEELEHALERQTVAPCVMKGSSTESILKRTTPYSPSSVMRQMAAAYQRGKGRGLVTDTPLECLLCAGRRDRVCYSPLQHHCAVERVAKGVRPFREPFTMVLEGYPLRHWYSYLPALRSFLFAVREGSLLTRIEDFCDYDADGLTEARIELQQFIMHYFILQLVSVATFVLECIVRYMSGRNSTQTTQQESMQ